MTVSLYMQKVGVSCHLEGSDERGYSTATFGPTTVDLDDNGRGSGSVPIRSVFMRSSLTTFFYTRLSSLSSTCAVHLIVTEFFLRHLPQGTVRRNVKGISK